VSWNSGTAFRHSKIAPDRRKKMNGVSTIIKWLGGSIAAVALLVVLLFLGPILWQMTFITFVIPKDFSGPITATYDMKGVDGSGVLKWRRYAIPADGKLRLKDVKPLYDWHVLKAVRSDGSEIVTFIPGGGRESPSGEFLFCGPSSSDGSGDRRRSTMWYHFGTETELLSWLKTAKPW
jgi:hypothetical protein